MKLIDIIKTSNTNLLRSKLRSFLTVLAIFIGTFTLTLTTGLGEGIRDFVFKQVSAIRAEGIIIVFPASRFGGSNPLEIKEYNPEKQRQVNPTRTLTDEDLKNLEEIANIKNVFKVYNTIPEYITREGQGKYEIPPFDPHIEGYKTPLAAGRVPNIDKNNEIILAYSYLKPLGFDKPEEAVGKKVIIAFKDNQGSLQEFEYEVVGVLVNSLSGAFTRANISEIERLSLIQTKVDRGASSILVTTDPKLTKKDFEKVKEDIRAKGYIATSIEDQINQLNAIINVIQAVLNGFAVIVILAGAIGIINTLLMAVYERTREIGLMKALGMKSGEIFIVFALEAVLLGFWGGVIGITVGMGVGHLVNYIASYTLLKDLQGFNLMAFPLVAVLPILLGTMIVGLLSGTLPAIKASKLNPIDALRYE